MMPQGNPDNWNVPQTVTVAADNDTEDGTATCRVSASEGIASKDVVVTEIDTGQEKLIRLAVVKAPSQVKEG